MHKVPIINLVDGENPWTTYFKRQVHKKNNCINMVTTGSPGSGKSWALLSELCKVNPDFDLNEQWFFQAKRLIRAFEREEIQKGKCYGYDEAGIDVNNLKWQDEVNKGLNAFFQTARHRNYIFGMTVPFMSMISKGVRVLMNVHWRTEGWNKNNETRVVPHILEYNGELDKFYHKRIIVRSDNGLDYCNGLRIPKPPKKIRLEYEKLKKEFTKDLFKSIGDKIEAYELKKSVVPGLRLTFKQEAVLELLKDGKTAEETAERRKCGVSNIIRIMESLKRKGIKIQPISDENNKTLRYNVVDTVTVPQN